jgi:hypothetical protein
MMWLSSTACAPSAAVRKKRPCLLTEIKTPKLGNRRQNRQRFNYALFSGIFALETGAFAHYISADATYFRAMFSRRYQPIDHLSVAAAHAKLAERRYL